MAAPVEVARVEVAIVGAGPAGMEAALQAAGAGATVALIDRQARPGGQYYKQPAPGVERHGVGGRREEEGRALLERLAALERVRRYQDTIVWGLFAAGDGEWLLALHGPAAPYRLRADAVILATGATDRVIPFPGWTLPGVVTAGAAQTLLEHQGVLPGRRILVSGSGPLLLTVAAGLTRAGADVVAVLEAARPSPAGLWRLAWALPGQRARLLEGWEAWRTLRAAGVPYHLGAAVVAAAGEEEVRAATFARLDGAGDPLPGSERTVAVDAVVAGHGFLSASRLARMAGCQHDFRPEVGGYVPRRDVNMETTRPGVFAAGDGAGVGGAPLSRIEGRIAGLASAARVGRLDAPRTAAALAAERPALRRERRFVERLGELFAPRPGLYGVLDEETVVCRCEEVTAGAIRRAAAAGAGTVDEVKGLTRAGMGNCQGRICEETVARLLARESGMDAAAVGCFTVRPPLYPLTVAELAEAA